MTPDWLTHIKNSPVSELNAHLFASNASKSKNKAPRRSSKIFLSISVQLEEWCDKNGFKLLNEHRFNLQRKYRFDWAIEEIRTAVEYNGGVFMQKSGHSNIKGSTRDADKINLAQSEGWKVLVFNAVNYKNIIQELEKHIK